MACGMCHDVSDQDDITHAPGLIMPIPDAAVSIGSDGPRSPGFMSPSSVDVGFDTPRDEDVTLPRVQVSAPGHLEIHEWTPYNTTQFEEALAQLPGRRWCTVTIEGGYVDWTQPFWKDVLELNITIPVTAVWSMKGVPVGEEMTSLKIHLPGERSDRFERPVHYHSATELLTSVMSNRGLWYAFVGDETQKVFYPVPRFQSQNSPRHKPHTPARVFEYDLTESNRWSWYCGPFCDLYAVAKKVCEFAEKDLTCNVQSAFQKAFEQQLKKALTLVPGRHHVKAASQ